LEGLAVSRRSLKKGQENRQNQKIQRLRNDTGVNRNPGKHSKPETDPVTLPNGRQGPASSARASPTRNNEPVMKMASSGAAGAANASAA